jgi:streptomycin 6-kinase
MQIFKQNMLNLYGERGKQWLAMLPTIIVTLSKHWHLYNIQPIENMTYHYVAKAISVNWQEVVIKIACDEKTICAEKKALSFFDGYACVKLLDYYQPLHALLLQQAKPGITLKTLYPSQPELVSIAYVTTMKKLHEKGLAFAASFQSITHWLIAIDNRLNDKIPIELLSTAIEIKNNLLATSTKQILLHGDLHHDNIIQDGNTWLAIDPKGIVGEPEFEIAAFDFLTESEQQKTAEIHDLLYTRIEIIANKSQLDAKRIFKWVFVRLALAAAWAIEDNMDASKALNLMSAININALKG